MQDEWALLCVERGLIAPMQGKDGAITARDQGTLPICSCIMRSIHEWRGTSRGRHGVDTQTTVRRRREGGVM